MNIEAVKKRMSPICGLAGFSSIPTVDAEALIAEIERMQHAFQMVADVEAGYYHLQHEIERLRAALKALLAMDELKYSSHGAVFAAAKLVEE